MHKENNAIADSACAFEKMMIAANALDLGTCRINRLHWLDENERKGNIVTWVDRIDLGDIR